MRFPPRGPTRRELLHGATSVALATGLPIDRAVARGARRWTRVPIPSRVERSWIGPDFWSNRLQDWRVANGRIECLRGEAGMEARTVALLTRALAPDVEAGSVRVRIGALAPGDGFAGMLLGVGHGELDWRAAALAQRGSGGGGGLFAAVRADGRAAILDHESEAEPLAFAPLAEGAPPASGSPFAGGRPVMLEATIAPGTGAGLDLLVLVRGEDGAELSRAALRDIPAHRLTGGLLIVSSPPRDAAGARFWFDEFATRGQRVELRPERAQGPILAALYTTHGRVLKLSAHVTTPGTETDAASQSVRLSLRPADAPNAAWRRVGEARVEHGGVARFRIADHDPDRDALYRLDYLGHGFEGRVGRDPGTAEPLRVALLGCVKNVARVLEDRSAQDPMPQARPLRRYGPENFFFPHAELTASVAAHDPHLLLITGDQFYETCPTRAVPDAEVEADTLYKWRLFLWAFRDLARNRPSLVLTDDHDVYQPNLWGNGGRPAPLADNNRGGFTRPARFVTMVQRAMSGHNPDDFDPTPIEQGIPISYGAFTFGGVSFAWLQDRAFKTGPMQGRDFDVHAPVLLGDRQEAFLERWAAMHPGAPKICVTQSMFGCIQTAPDGTALLDFDANGYPTLGARRALRLLRDANAMVLAGDQHLPSLVRSGVDDVADGPLQFSGPAGGTQWQRWFEPRQPDGQAAFRGPTDFVDAFGHKHRVLAVANPTISYAEYRQHVPGRPQGINDRRLRSEGFGLVRIDHTRRQATIECWPWNARGPDARQFAGWPQVVSFDRFGRDVTPSSAASSEADTNADARVAAATSAWST